MKWVIRNSSAINLGILTVLFIISFSFSRVLARNPVIAKTNVPSYADPGEDPHLRMDTFIQADPYLQSSSDDNRYDSGDLVPVSTKGKSINTVSRVSDPAYKFRFVFYSIFGIYVH